MGGQLRGLRMVWDEERRSSPECRYTAGGRTGKPSPRLGRRWPPPSLCLDVASFSPWLSSALTTSSLQPAGSLDSHSISLPSDESPLWPLHSFFVTGGFNLVLMRFLRKSQSSVEINETFMRVRKRKICNGSRSILSSAQVVTVVEYCYQNYNTVTTKPSGVTRQTRQTVSLIRGIEII